MNKLRSGFSLMEMMVVMLIVAVVAAASAPMISKKMTDDAASNDSPWVWTGTNNSIAYNLKGDSNATTIIGGVQYNDANQRTRLYIKTNNDNTSQIRLADTNDNKVNIGLIGNSLYMTDGMISAANSVVIGKKATTSQAGSTIIGYNATTGGATATAIGYEAKASGVNSVAIGLTNSVSGANSTAIGYGARTDDDNSVAIGHAHTIGSNEIAIGYNAYSDGGTAIGYGATADDTNTLALGTATANGAYSTAVGYNAKTSHTSSSAFGRSANASGTNSTAVGYVATAGGTGSTALGYGANSGGTSSTALGYGATASKTKSTAIGYGAVTNADNQIMIGRSDSKVDIPGSLSAASANITGTLTAKNANVTNTLTATNFRTNALYDTSGKLIISRSNGIITIGDSTTPVYFPGGIRTDKISDANNNAMITTYRDSARYIKLNTNTVVNGTFSTNGFTQVNSAFTVTGAVNLSTNSKKVYMGVAQTDGSDAKFSEIRRRRGSGWDDLTMYQCDRRLKNIGEIFKGGLAEIKKLEVFNYTYKKDTEKIPHVGVMAQDLQKIFPKAVFKGEDGFLRIRMEDMFYALVNAVKELDAKIDLLAQKQKKIDELEKRIEKLEQRLAKLEKKLK